MPMAQSAVSTMTWAVFSMRRRMLISGSPSNTSRIMLESWARPMRQGTHLPQVWAWHRFRKFRAMSTGHKPGGLAAIRRSILRYNCSTTAWAAPGILTSNLLISVVLLLVSVKEDHIASFVTVSITSLLRKRKMFLQKFLGYQKICYFTNADSSKEGAAQSASCKTGCRSYIDTSPELDIMIKAGQ